MMTNNTTKSKSEKDLKPPKPSAGHERLNAFVGKWNTKGQQYQGPVGSAAKITAVDTFEWASGEFFLIHRFEGRVGANDASCIEIIGFDTESKSYPTHTFYNTGLTNEWQNHERDGVWTLTGNWEMGGKKVKVRCTTVFSDGGDTMTGKWELSSEGAAWQTFWDVEASKAK